MTFPKIYLVKFKPIIFTFFLVTWHELFMNYYYSDMFFFQLYRAKSDPEVIIFQISGGKFLNYYEK